MKRLLLILVTLVTLISCENVVINDSQLAKVKFSVYGNFSQNFTRGTIAENNALTDLWVFDFVDGECVQSIHQQRDDADWGAPTLMLTTGSHNICFVASRGTDASVNATNNTITWSKPSDTFWKNFAVDVTGGGNQSRTVTLERIVTKLKVSVLDEIPSDISNITITPATWYNSINYTTGEPVSPLNNQERTISVPSTYIGTTGSLTATIYGFCGEGGLTTDVGLYAHNGSGTIIGQAVIQNAPFERNVSTEYRGKMFNESSGFSLLIDDNWSDSYEGEW